MTRKQKAIICILLFSVLILYMVLTRTGVLDEFTIEPSSGFVAHTLSNNGQRVVFLNDNKLYIAEERDSRTKYTIYFISISRDKAKEYGKWIQWNRDPSHEYNCDVSPTANLEYEIDEMLYNNEHFGVVEINKDTYYEIYNSDEYKALDKILELEESSGVNND